MDQTSSLLKKYYLYSRERFPLPGVLCYTLSQYLLSYLLPNLLGSHSPMKWSDGILGFIVVFCTILRLRIVDEHKDYEKDVKLYPDRMLSKGLISLKDLKWLFAVAAILEILICIHLGAQMFKVWLVINTWFGLMWVEFFAPVYLNNHIGIYLITHQLLVPLLALFGISQRIDVASITRHQGMIVFIFLTSLLFGTMTYEIARKTWNSERDNSLAASYTLEWGKGITVIINSTFALICGAGFTYLMLVSGIKYIYILPIVIMFIMFVITEMAFLKNPDEMNSKRIEKMGAIYMLVVFSIAISAFYNT